MRTMLLSFRPDVYSRVISGEKIYEHRKVFPNEPIKAYLYVSRPIQAITGIMYLNNKKNISDWKVEYAYDKNAVKRIDNYLKTNNVVMEITRFEETNQLLLKDIRSVFPSFVVPQMYYFLDELPLLDYIEKNLVCTGKVIEHSFENITSDMICVH